MATINLQELEIEARIIITPQGEVEMSFMPWTQWNIDGQSFEELVEDFNLLKAQVRLCLENQGKEELSVPSQD